MLFRDGSIRDVQIYHHVLELHCKASGLEVNERNSSIMFHKTILGQENTVKDLFSFQEVNLQKYLKYLSFYLKANEYGFHDYLWIYNKIEGRISLWYNIWISLGRRLNLVKVVLEAILGYGHSLTYISKGILNKNKEKYVYVIGN